MILAKEILNPNSNSLQQTAQSAVQIPMHVSISNSQNQNNQQPQQQRNRKWPSFTMKRSNRFGLSSTTSTLTNNLGGQNKNIDLSQKHQSLTTNIGCENFIPRSMSIERQSTINNIDDDKCGGNLTPCITGKNKFNNECSSVSMKLIFEKKIILNQIFFIKFY